MEETEESMKATRYFYEPRRVARNLDVLLAPSHPMPILCNQDKSMNMVNSVTLFCYVYAFKLEPGSLQKSGSVLAAQPP